jgi:hypothetical protein
MKLFKKPLNYKQIELPVRGDSWKEIKLFAMKINGYDIKGSFKGAADIGNKTELSGMNIQDLHVAIFFEYRRHNHFGYAPDQKDMERIYTILDRMNDLQNQA